MAAKKNTAKRSSTNRGVDIWQYLNLPPEIIQLLRSRRRRTKRSPLHHMNTACFTSKSWLPATIRCSKSVGAGIYLVGNSSNTSSASPRQIMTYRADEPPWMRFRYECTIIDPFDPKKKRIEFTSVIGLHGKFYALSLQGTLAVIESVDSRLTVTDISTSRCVPSEKSRFFKEYLIELNGEIFLLYFIHQKSLEIVDKIEVFHLCFVKFKWIKVERFQGKTLFLDRRCSWVNSAEIGCRGDCIYFTMGSDNGWWIYDMETCCILPTSIISKT